MPATLALGRLPGSSTYNGALRIPDWTLGRYAWRGYDYDASDTEIRKTVSMRTLILTCPKETDDKAPLA
jgi:hypothetical protein